MVLDHVEVGDLDQPLGRRQGHGRAEQLTIHPERDHTADPITRCDNVVRHPLRRHRDRASPLQRGRCDEAPAATQSTAVADVRPVDKLTAGDMHKRRRPVTVAGQDCGQTADGSPEPMHDVGPALGPRGADRSSQHSAEWSRAVGLRCHVDHRRAEQWIAAGLGFLAECDDRDVVFDGQALDEPQHGRNDPVGPAAIHASGHNQRYMHEPSMAVSYGRSMLVADQDVLLRWTLDLLDGNNAPCPLGGWTTERFARAGFASGLSAVIGAAAGRLGVALTPAVRGYVSDQMLEVAARHDRFVTLLPRLLTSLADAGVAALPVKGAVLTQGLWPYPNARPMSDIDLLVDPSQRGAAAQACEAQGWPLVDSNAWEDTFLAWGDGGTGRIDGESADHNGKVEVHPGWVERLHGYVIDDGGVVFGSAVPGRVAGVGCLVLSPAALAAYVLGHLSATVIRGEARPLHVADCVVVLGSLDPTEHVALSDLLGALDPRLSAPGLWLMAKYRPDCAPAGLRETALARLSVRAASQLANAASTDVLRGTQSRTSWRWRSAFSTSIAEQSAAFRQLLWPATEDLHRGGDDRAAWRLHGARALRGVRRHLGGAAATP